MSGLAPESLAFEFVEIGNLPLFNQDLESTPPSRMGLPSGKGFGRPMPSCS